MKALAYIDEAWRECRIGTWGGAGWRFSGGEVTPPAESAAFYPDNPDPLAQQIRPMFPPLLTDTVAPGEKIGAKLDALYQERKRLLGTQRADERHMVHLTVEPGEYNESLGWVAEAVIVSSTGNPDDVRIIGDYSSASRGTMHLEGSSYIEGITIEKPPKPEGLTGASLVYPIHAAQTGTKIFVNVHLVSDAGFLYGADGGPAGTTMFLGSAFTNNGAQATNIHGGNTKPDWPMTVIFKDCTINAGTIVVDNVGSGSALAETYMLNTEATVRSDGPVLTDPPEWPIPEGGLGRYDRHRLFVAW